MYLLVFTWVDVRTTQVAFLPKLLSSIAPIIAHLLRPFSLHKKYKNRIALSFLLFFLLCLPLQVSDTRIPTRSTQKHLTPYLHRTQGRTQISYINEKQSTRLNFSFMRQLFGKVFGDLLQFMIPWEIGVLHYMYLAFNIIIIWWYVGSKKMFFLDLVRNRTQNFTFCRKTHSFGRLGFPDPLPPLFRT